MFAVLYRFKLKAGTEPAFREAWRTGTHAIRSRYGTSGSRLHRTDDGALLAYAVWPDRAAWEKAQTLASASPESGAVMRACMAEPLTTTPLDVIDDLLITDALANPTTP
jgi:Antibiotic biosynthesis monooxygenase